MRRRSQEEPVALIIGNGIEKEGVRRAQHYTAEHASRWTGGVAEGDFARARGHDRDTKPNEVDAVRLAGYTAKVKLSGVQ